ncbi:MAG: hypothetical protein KF851_09450 [Pirellulaceae bacterium]|nr:hypothetical protein [Pirellulaceae bacterium]
MKQKAERTAGQAGRDFVVGFGAVEFLPETQQKAALVERNVGILAIRTGDF